MYPLSKKITSNVPSSSGDLAVLQDISGPGVDALPLGTLLNLPYSSGQPTTAARLLTIDGSQMSDRGPAVFRPPPGFYELPSTSRWVSSRAGHGQRVTPSDVFNARWAVLSTTAQTVMNSATRDRVAAIEDRESSSTVARVLYTGYFQDLDKDDDIRNSPATQPSQWNSGANQTHNIITEELRRIAQSIIMEELRTMFEDAPIVSNFYYNPLYFALQ